MIFQHTYDLILSQLKNETRRIVKEGQFYSKTDRAIYNTHRLWLKTGKDYAVQPGRGKESVARILIQYIYQEQLQKIDESCARLEGFNSIEEFKETWDKINKKPYSWNDNPLVWVIGFKLK